MHAFAALRLLPLFAGLAATGCATLTQGANQRVPIHSSPSGAQVWINGRDSGTTPTTASLRRKDQHTIRFVLYPYATKDITLERRISGWFWGNIAFGGLVGIAIDAATGAMYKLTPADVHQHLGPEAAGSPRRERGRLIIAVVLEPQADWERIGCLQHRTGGSAAPPRMLAPERSPWDC
jgi:hypothetical protein